MEAVSVVIPTVWRPRLLQRAIMSIERQDYRGPIDVVVVTANDQPAALQTIQKIVDNAKVRCSLRVVVLDAERVADNPQLAIYRWSRVAYLRNIGVTTVQGKYVAHLDDDNEYLPTHLSSLVEVLERVPELPAAHSWRHLLWKDGSPFTENLYPWLKQPERARARYIFDELIHYGVFQRDSCEMRDRYTTPMGEQLLTIDSSEWLIRRSFHSQFPFRERLHFRELSHALTDDYLFCQHLADSGVRIGCSEQFTLNYYLSGRTALWLREARRDA